MRLNNNSLLEKKAKSIADFFNIGPAYYYEELIRNFNAHIGIGWELCFDTNEECEKAIDWINSLYIVNKLLDLTKG